MTNSECLLVTFGDYPCAISGDVASDGDKQVITCNINSTPEGMEPMPALNHHLLNVRQGPYGYSMINQISNTDRHFFLLPITTGITPTVGSVGGGVSVTISGEGYLSDVTVANIDGNPCDVLEIEYSQIVCITQSRISASNGFAEVSNELKTYVRLSSWRRVIVMTMPI